MEAGSAFRFGRHTHLWVVVSNPAFDRKHVVIINMTSDGIDQSCVLEPEDHSFIRHRTFMRYDKARITTDADLERLVASGDIILHDAVSADLLARIREGTATTDRIPFGCKQVLIDQSLIEL
ncbi:MAG: hypothetical protein ABSG68_07390 [Thermoguttaceae bacterium]|jgi:hypothetical protein